MKIQLETHPGLIIDNFTKEIISIFHVIKSKKITVTILFKSENISILHESKELDLENGIPTELELFNMVEYYIKTLEIK